MPILTSTLIAALKNHLGAMNQAELAAMLGVTQGTISNWVHDAATPTKPQVVRIVKAFRTRMTRDLITPLIEYRSISPNKIGNAWTFGLQPHELKIVRKYLLGKHGIYVFYSSAGAPIYVGKSTNCLFTESKTQLKADLNRAVRLPKKLKDSQVGAIACFMSAYQINVSEATKNIESFLLRAFANGLYNKNSGEFQ